MPGGPKAVLTRFRAYQLGNAGSSFSYFAEGRFTLIEGRAPTSSRPSLLEELRSCGKREIDTLHITSWDEDHCCEAELVWILHNLQPNKIEYPGYAPATDCGRASLAAIRQYQMSQAARQRKVVAQSITPEYIRSLGSAKDLAYNDIFYHPKYLVADSNDNSTVKLFRAGAFNVASLGDVENPSIGAMLCACRIFKREVDVLILAHHGADSGVTTRKFLQVVEPSVAICTSNYDNQYEHPNSEVRGLLHEKRIPLYTTKTGDVLVQSVAGHQSRYQVWNLVADSTKVNSTAQFRSKKARLLSMNADTVRNIYRPGFKGLK